MKLFEVENFGAIDADADDLLRECFQDHPAYIEARDMKKFLILGRKGSGKTAIYKQLIGKYSNEHFSFGYSFNDYPWQHHDLQAKVGVPEELRYVPSWQYLILMGLSKILLNMDQSQPWSDESFNSIETIERFVVDSYGSRDPDMTQLFSPEVELRFKGELNFKVLKFATEGVKVRELPIHIQEVNKSILNHVMSALNPEHRYYVCFDQLDIGFDPKNKDYKDRLIGLILAARSLFLAARDAGKKLNIVVFLRDDIYQELQFEDKNKITENYTTEVDWKVTGKGLTLKDLMESRFQQTLQNSQIEEYSWEYIFNEEREMPSRQSKYQHICDRTLLRPRDMIKFCNEVLKAYKDSTEGQGGKFDNEHIHLARDIYSNYLLKEIDDEIAKHTPDYKMYLEVIKTIGTEKFTLEDFSRIWESRFEGRLGRPDYALEELFDFSIIGYLKPGGRGGGSEYVWRYKNPRARFDPTVESYRVHPGFKEALELATWKS
jgi:hypothetical protein